MIKTTIFTVLLAGIAFPAGASQFQAFDRAAQIQGSELIATGRVVAIWSDWSFDRSVVFTDVEIALDEVWKGAPASDRVFVRTPGGTVDGVTLEVDGAATFSEGEEVLVFLDDQGDWLVPWGMRFGKYAVVGSLGETFLVGSLPPAVTGAQKYVQVSIPESDLRAEVAAALGQEDPR